MIVKSNWTFTGSLTNIIATIANVAVNQIKYVRSVTRKVRGCILTSVPGANVSCVGDNVLTDLTSWFIARIITTESIWSFQFRRCE